MGKLTQKQAQFVEEYLIDLNATQAAIRAGYSEKTARFIGQENLTKPNIAVVIQEAMSERSERVQIDADYVLRRHAEIDQMDVADILDGTGSVLPIHRWPRVWRQYISGFDVIEIAQGGDKATAALKKIKWPDKVRNLELLGKHVDVGAYRERTELTGKDGGPIKTVTVTADMDPREAARIYKEWMNRD